MGRHLHFALLWLAGCGGPGGSADPKADDDTPPDRSCSDLDGDGFGVGPGCEGADCNDSVPSIHTDAQCVEYCGDGSNPRSGCACGDAREPELCYGGSEASMGHGPCRAGLMICEAGTWGPCEGQVLPSDEICNDVDDDCDDEVDEGVRSACGDCNPDCVEDCIGVDCDPFDPAAAGAEGVVLTPEGALTLDGRTTIENYVIWIASSSEGTVSKVNTRTREEEGRYDTGPSESAWGSNPDNPSRTTVNGHGDVVVANRGAVGEATKFLASDCPDVDGDGVVETSTGPDDVLPWRQDECFVWSTPIGSGARGSAFELRLGLDGEAEEYVWVGDYGHMDIHELDSETGELTGRTIPGIYPYGVAIGPDDTLWSFDSRTPPFQAGGSLVEVKTTDEDLETTLIPLPAGENYYGLTVDGEGRVWVGGTVSRYDPDEEEWDTVPGLDMQTGGIACDGEGNAYVGELPGTGAGWARGNPVKIDADTLETTALEGVGGHGWAVDFDGYIWSVEYMGTRAFVTNPDTLEHEDTVLGFVGAYTYSDMTGFQLANATNPLGVYPFVVEGCPEGEDVHWAELSWDATVPASTNVSFAVKSADDLAGLAAASPVTVAVDPPDASPFDLGAALDAAGIEAGNLLSVEVSLRSIDRASAPTLRSVHVSRSCARPLQ